MRKDKYVVNFILKDGYSDSFNCSSKRNVIKEIKALYAEFEVTDCSIRDIEKGVYYDSLMSFIY